MVDVNEYFEGKIKSLGFEKNNTKYTIGVVEPDSYELSTNYIENIEVILGVLEFKRSSREEWETVREGERISIPANKKFQLKAGQTSAYKCYYT